MLKDMKKMSQEEEEGKDRTKEAKAKKARKLADNLGRLKRIAFNLKSEQDAYVHEFIRCEGIKEIMFLAEESQALDEMDMVLTCT